MYFGIVQQLRNRWKGEGVFKQLHFYMGEKWGVGGAGGQMIIVLPRNASADDYSVPWF